MEKHISKSDSEKGRAIWEGVSKAAEQCPDWVRPQVEEAARESARRIIEKARRNDPKG
jgi:hypothetical protein